MKETEKAYIAGITDGEAYIGIKKTKAYAAQGRKTPGYHARVQIRMVDESAIKFVAGHLGGTYYGEKPHPGTGRPLFCYQASDKKAEVFIRTILPYMRVKRATAETVLELRELQATGWLHRTKITGHRDLKHWCGKVVRVANKSFSDEYVARCEFFYLKCKKINSGEL